MINIKLYSDHISILEIKIQITTVIQTITENFIETENFLPTWGYHLHTYLQTNNLTSENISVFIQQFASAKIEKLNRRFSNHEILNTFCIFDSQNLPEKDSLSDYGNNEINILAKYYGVEKTSM
ncbi:zinc finger protein [Gigaspora margarita]|uniref:Zinc finger protein n=1 Tax=Gigaspora margarita TaxID=4874 RepID=A0A8H4AN03_GIGMA|nr:zinc finger protein [Gigaspora margarita]